MVKAGDGGLQASGSEEVSLIISISEWDSVASYELGQDLSALVTVASQSRVLDHAG